MWFSVSLPPEPLLSLIDNSLHKMLEGDLDLHLDTLPLKELTLPQVNLKPIPEPTLLLLSTSNNTSSPQASTGSLLPKANPNLNNPKPLNLNSESIPAMQRELTQPMWSDSRKKRMSQMESSTNKE